MNEALSALVVIYLVIGLVTTVPVFLWGYRLLDSIFVGLAWPVLIIWAVRSRSSVKSSKTPSNGGSNDSSS